MQEIMQLFDRASKGKDARENEESLDHNRWPGRISDQNLLLGTEASGERFWLLTRKNLLTP